MNLVMVHISVKKNSLSEFIQATIENAKNSRLEEGIARFDFVQSEDDETKFILIEVYKTAEAQLAHKETAHYKKWRDTVADMMEEPRKGVKYKTLYPVDEDW